MKRAREQAEASQGVEPDAFACGLSPSGSGFSFTVQLPSELLAGSTVLTEMAALGGSPAPQKQPECLLAWLAWHASRRAEAEQGGTEAPPWDGEVDAFNVRPSPVSGLPCHRVAYVRLNPRLLLLRSMLNSAHLLAV